MRKVWIRFSYSVKIQISSKKLFHSCNFLFFSNKNVDGIKLKTSTKRLVILGKNWLAFSTFVNHQANEWRLLFGSKVSISSVCLLVYSIVFVFSSFVHFLVFFLFLHSNFCLFIPTLVEFVPPSLCNRLWERTEVVERSNVEVVLILSGAVSKNTI